MLSPNAVGMSLVGASAVGDVSGGGRGPKFECYADKMREIGWFLLLYLVCVLCQSA